MLVFQNYRELSASMARPDGFRFLPSHGPAGFICAQCKKTIQFPMSGGGTGYGRNRDSDDMHCYECCTENDKQSMQTANRFGGYLSGDGRHFTSWPGGILGTVCRESTSRTGRHGTELTHVQVRDVHGKYWHGKGAGRGMCVTLTRCKGG